MPAFAVLVSPRQTEALRSASEVALVKALPEQPVLFAAYWETLSKAGFVVAPETAHRLRTVANYLWALGFESFLHGSQHPFYRHAEAGRALSLALSRALDEVSR